MMTDGGGADDRNGDNKGCDDDDKGDYCDGNGGCDDDGTG